MLTTLKTLTPLLPTATRTARLPRQLLAVGVAVALSLGGLAFAQEKAPMTAAEPGDPQLSFDLVSSQGVQDCLPEASGRVTLRALGPVENMRVEVKGLPPDTEFDLFVIQVPDPPFGLS
jgi:hypothetical protein